MKLSLCLIAVLFLAISILVATPLSHVSATSGSSHHAVSGPVVPDEGSSIPEPATFLLIGGGLLAIGILGTRAMRA